MDRKRILFLMRHAPYASSQALEALEAALVAGVFDQTVSVLFSGDGVWQLLGGQDGGAVGRRSVSKVAQVLPEYDITAIYVCAASLRERGLTPADLALAARAVEPGEQRTLIADHDAVVND